MPPSANTDEVDPLAPCEFKSSREVCDCDKKSLFCWLTIEKSWTYNPGLTLDISITLIEWCSIRWYWVWHQKEQRVLTHILICVLAYVFWKAIEGLCRQAGLGNEPRKVFHELSHIKLTDVILPTRNGKEIRLRCVAISTQHQRILLQNLKLNLPKRFSKCNL
jgi:hypothetical protein